MNILGLISQLIGIKTLRLTERNLENGPFKAKDCKKLWRLKIQDRSKVQNSSFGKMLDKLSRQERHDPKEYNY